MVNTHTQIQCAHTLHSSFPDIRSYNKTVFPHAAHNLIVLLSPCCQVQHEAVSGSTSPLAVMSYPLYLVSHVTSGDIVHTHFLLCVSVYHVCVCVFVCHICKHS